MDTFSKKQSAKLTQHEIGNHNSSHPFKKFIVKKNLPTKPTSRYKSHRDVKYSVGNTVNKTEINNYLWCQVGTRLSKVITVQAI